MIASDTMSEAWTGATRDIRVDPTKSRTGKTIEARTGWVSSSGRWFVFEAKKRRDRASFWSLTHAESGLRVAAFTCLEHAQAGAYVCDLAPLPWDTFRWGIQNPKLPRGSKRLRQALLQELVDCGAVL